MTLFSEAFMEFFKAIPTNVGSVEELSGYIVKAFHPVADALGIGKLEITLNSPANAFESPVKNSTLLLYHYRDGYSDNAIKDCFVTGGNGEVTLRTYPRKGQLWDDEATENIHLLGSIIFTLCGKARLTKLMNIASFTDGTTGAHNVTGITRFIGSLCSQGVESDYTALFINIKNFRYITQSLGPKNGDTVLKKYSMRIHDFLKNDEVFGRLGGDNFVAVVKNEHLEEFLDLISAVHLHINQNGKITTFDVAARAGIYPIQKGDRISTVMNNISMTINIAKQSRHHDFIWFRPEMSERFLHDKEMSNDFAKALEQKEFEVYYQPKVFLSDNSLCGSEALVRWRRGDTLMQPEEFIPLLEREGSVCALEFYMLDNVCQHIRDWLDRSITPVRVSVNFSKLHLHNRRFAEDIIAVLNRYDVDASYIEIELTETSGYEDFDALSTFVNKMREYGIHTSIDDFGTGYSSLNLLCDLDVDVIKLDKSFLTTSSVQAPAGEQKSSFRRPRSNIVVIKTIINLAIELGMEVICEGVETKEHAQMLKDLGCHMAQGFLFGAPLPHDEYEKRLKNGTGN